jgi:hypothetical protein
MAATHHHGKTPAAWTGVIITFVGFCAAGGFMVAAQPVPFWVSIGVTLLGPLVGGLMKVMGFGSRGEPILRSALQKAEEAEREEPRTPANA